MTGVAFSVSSEIHGQKWDDHNGNGVRDSGEPGLNNWVIELYDSGGQLVESQTTADIDLDDNGTIDPESERGLYRFTGLVGGTYRVREVQQEGWEQTSPVGVPVLPPATLSRPSHPDDGANASPPNEVEPGTGPAAAPSSGDSAADESTSNESWYAEIDTEHHDEPFSNYVPPQTRLIEPGAYLTSATAGEPLDIALEFLRTNAVELGLSTSDFDDYVVTDQYVSAHNGVTHLYLRQMYRGLEIAGADLNLNVTRDGEIINVGSSFIAGLPAARGTESPKLSAAEALSSFAAQLDMPLVDPPSIVSPAAKGVTQTTVLSGSGISTADIPASLQYVPSPRAALIFPGG